ncbi:MAG: saccharopine dehydrogenase [Acidobacteria bacterium]|nr:MAG: saccharopine dehydrogenase [Acidobacteriota bacterium]
MTSPYLIYGANGYTGELIAREAARRGQRPFLAGRNAAAGRALASELGLEPRAFVLDDARATDGGLDRISAVLHCAGPFVRTSRPMADACLRRKVHYLDVTGEIDVFEALAARDREAAGAGVMLLPGVGFDVVPSDCLAAHLKRRLPSATRLALAFHSIGGLSRGTATTIIENLHRGGRIRRGGALAHVPAAWKTRRIDFGPGPRTAVSIPWGDVATAYYSTGIPDIEVYTTATRPMRIGMRASRLLAPLLASSPVQSFLKRRIQRGAPGPTADQRARGRTLLWGEAADEAGRRVESRLRGPDGYTFTVLTALAAIEKALSGAAPAGFQTPAKAYGPDFVLGVEGVSREDL